eukprot:4089743-Amphidinium_carterae.2
MAKNLADKGAYVLYSSLYNTVYTVYILSIYCLYHQTQSSSGGWPLIHHTGMSLEHKTIANYYKKMDSGAVDHSLFLNALSTYIKKHNDNPENARLHSRKDLELPEVIKKKDATGEEDYAEFTFMEMWYWRKQHPGIEPPNVHKREVEGKGVVEGVLVRDKPEGEHK